MLTLLLPPFGHLDHRRPEQPIAQHVAAAELFDDLAVAAPLSRFVRDGLVIVRIEVGAERLDRPDAALAQDLEQLPMDQLDAAAIGLGAFGAGVGLERALEIVDERQELRRSGRRRPPPTTLCRSRSIRLR